MKYEKKRSFRRSRTLEFGMVAATLLSCMSRVCHANPIYPGPVEALFQLSLFLQIPFVVFLVATGVFLYVRMLICGRKLTVHDGRSQLYIIGYILIGYLTAGFLIGLWFYYKGIRKAIELYRTAFVPPEGELLGRRRFVNMIVAILLLVPFNAFLMSSFLLKAILEEDGAWITALLIEMITLYRPEPMALFRGGELSGITVIVTCVFVVFTILAVVWLIRYVMLLAENRNQKQRLRGVFADGLAVFGYIAIGHCALPFFAGLWFYYLAVRLAVSVVGKYHNKAVPKSSEEETAEGFRNDTVE